MKKLFLIILWLFFFISGINAGTFNLVQEPMGNDLGVRMSSIAFGDIDNDGDLDLAVTGQDNSDYIRFIIFKNNNGIYNYFQEPMGTNQGVYSSSIVFSDIDNDGDLDLAVTGDDGVNQRFIIFRNNNSSFSLYQEPMGINQGFESSSITSADIDNDGDQDLAVAGSKTFRRFIIFLNNNGNFTPSQEPMGINQGFESSSIIFGDIDNDEDLDLAVTGYDGVNQRFIIYTNNNGIFNLYQEPMGSNQGLGAGSTAFGDIDNDGDLDIAIIGSTGTHQSFIIFQNDEGMFTNIQEPIGTNQGVSMGSIALGDIDNDGDLDLAITGTYGGSSRFIIYQNDNAHFTNIQEPIGIDEGFSVYSSMAFGDIDNDGDLDIAVTGRESLTSKRRFIIFKNNENTINNPPPFPKGLSINNIGGYWRFNWNAPLDDHTPENILRYKIAIGTNTILDYNYISSNMDYPRGQANIGNICMVTAEYYQSTIPVSKSVYWKVWAIDSALKMSGQYPYQPEGTNGTSTNDFSTDFTENKLRILPNYIGPNDFKEIKIFFGEVNQPAKQYRVRILSIAGRRMIRDLGDISYQNLYNGISWNLKDDNNKTIPSGIYILLLTGNNKKYTRNFYHKK